MRYFARICAHARCWREFAKCRFAHFPSFFSVHVDTYEIESTKHIIIDHQSNHYSSISSIDNIHVTPAKFADGHLLCETPREQVKQDIEWW